MPLVRVSGRDAESFDTFDVAEMTDNWSSRQSGTGGAASANPRHTKSALSPTLETEDLTSIDSSGRRSDETDRVGSIPPRGSMSGMHRLSHSSISVGSTNSHYTPPASLSGNFDSAHSNHSPYSSNVPLYETVDNLDGIQHDPRNTFNKSHNSMRPSWSENIPEEDETSLSTMEDSSVTPGSIQQQPNHYQNQHPRSNSQHMHQPQHRSHRHRSISELDDVSVISNQSRQDFNRKIVNKKDDNSSCIISQLESQVAQINFELATTKSSLDELQLENRRLNDDKEKLTTNITLLKEENVQLYLKIERLEKEKILRNMEGTKGVARSSTDQDSYVVWDGGAMSENAGAGVEGSSILLSNRAYVPVTKQRSEKVGDSLEVPFRTAESDYHLRPKRLSVSVASFNELSIDGDGASRGETDCNHSIALNASSHSLGSHQLSDTEDHENIPQMGRQSFLNIIVGGKRPTVRDVSKPTEEACISSPSHRKSEPEKEAAKPTRPLPSNQKAGHLETSEDGENDIGSNPQGEDFNDDDPFATWSEPGDPKRKEPEQNWLKRGLGGRGRNNRSSQQPPPQSNDIIEEDPFDSCNGDQRNSFDDTEKYTSFADNASDRSDSIDNGEDTAAGRQDRHRFGLFKGLMGGGRR